MQADLLNNEFTGTFSENDKLEMCRRGVRFKERVYVPAPKGNCPKCGDVGFVIFWYDGYEYAERCDCSIARLGRASIRKAGIRNDVTFDNFYTDKDFQKSMKAKAQQFVKDGYLAGQWFFIGGQSGCGKTHICTAILHDLINQGASCRYMAWRDEAVHLKSIVNQHEEYHSKIMELCNVPVLYIDDFWKVQNGTSPTQADVNLGFQILNFRYNSGKVTVISSEYMTGQLLDIDEATAGRIIEKSKPYQLNVKKDIDKNYRLRNRG
jgi:DNA replication protein DnaC